MESSHPEHPGARGEERTGAGREKRGGARGLTLRTASSVSIAELKTKSALFCQRMGCASVSAPHVLCPRRVCGVRWSVECGVWSAQRLDGRGDLVGKDPGMLAAAHVVPHAQRLSPPHHRHHGTARCRCCDRRPHAHTARTQESVHQAALSSGQARSRT